jgi:eukaryotic-like serine/threonine-protein kinase
MNIDYILNENTKNLSSFFKEFLGEVSEEALYENIDDDRLKFCFAIFHVKFNNLFSYLNEKTSYNNHCNAAESRELIALIDFYNDLKWALSKTQYAFEIRDTYQKAIDFIKPHLSNSGGSAIPTNYKSLFIIRYEPIIFIADTFEKSNNIPSPQSYSLKIVSQGSYAIVYKYKDKFYDEVFAIKRAKKDLTSNELERFKKEFLRMKELDSPYILKVYTYNEKINEFYMEYVQYTLKEYVEKYSVNIILQKRKQIVNQLFSAFNYIHSKDIYHRDISLSNVLIKECDDGTAIVKICDFGYLKEKNSTLTRKNTEFEGSLNDPHLRMIGADKYNIQHEVYALTQVIYYVMTGKKNLQKNKSKSIEEFISFGMNTNLKERAKDLLDLKKKFLQTNWEK